MRPDQARPIRSASSAQDTQQFGPRGSVPADYLEARQRYNRGDIDGALDLLAPLCEATDQDRNQDVDLVDAARLRAWCLIAKKDHEGCRQWLQTARGRGLLDEDDLGASVVELHVDLIHERYARVETAALELLERVENPAAIDHAELRLLLGAALRWQGRTAEAVGHVDYACSAFKVLQEPGRQAAATNFLGWTHVALGRLDDARRAFEQSLEINSELGAELRIAQNYQNLAIICYKQGAFDQAVELLEKELTLVADHPDMLCRARIALGNVQRLRGESLEARQCLLTAYSLATEQGLAREECLSLEFLGDVLRDEDNPSEARRYYQRALTVARDIAPRGDLVMELLRREGECLDREGRHDEAHHLLNEARHLCEEVGDGFELAVTRRCLGVNSARLGRWRPAVEHLEAAVAALQDMGARSEELVAHFHLAKVLLRQIDTGNAGAGSSRLLDQAWRHALVAQRLGMELTGTRLTVDVDDLVGDLARRRLQRPGTTHRPAVFSMRRAPATRVIAVSEAMQRVLRRCDGFARYDNSILVTGESGSGKVLLARRIHENSPRGAQPFIRIGCAATSAEVLAREIFGHAETDGERAAQGLVNQADGGTLLLTGIGELPRELQGKLLRLIQEGTYRPLGDGRECRVDVRIVVTSDVDLSELVEDGRFRPDLYFRLRLMSVTVPPLRERREDIMPLLDHFLTKLEGSSLSARSLFDFQALEALATHAWPGGAAELEAIAQQAWLNRDLGRPVALRRVDGPRGGSLEFVEPSTKAAALEPRPKGSPRDRAAQSLLGPRPRRTTVGRGHPSGMTWSALNSLIDRAGGNKARVARNLGISRITLYRWLKQLDPEA